MRLRKGDVSEPTDGRGVVAAGVGSVAVTLVALFVAVSAVCRGGGTGKVGKFVMGGGVAFVVAAAVEETGRLGNGTEGALLEVAGKGVGKGAAVGVDAGAGAASGGGVAAEVLAGPGVAGREVADAGASSESESSPALAVSGVAGAGSDGDGGAWARI